MTTPKQMNEAQVAEYIKWLDDEIAEIVKSKEIKDDKDLFLIGGKLAYKGAKTKFLSLLSPLPLEQVERGAVTLFPEKLPVTDKEELERAADEREIACEALKAIDREIYGRDWMQEGSDSYHFKEEQYNREFKMFVEAIRAQLIHAWKEIRSGTMQYRKRIIALHAPPLPSAEQQGEKHFEYLADTQKAKAENPKPVFTFNEREQQGWISVKDGLPKDDDFVLFVHFHAGWQAIIEEYAGKFSEVKYFRKHQLENSYTHWRLLPLPSPPVEEKDTKK